MYRLYMYHHPSDRTQDTNEGRRARVVNNQDCHSRRLWGQKLRPGSGYVSVLSTVLTTSTIQLAQFHSKSWRVGAARPQLNAEERVVVRTPSATEQRSKA